MEKSPRPKAKPENLVEMNRLSGIMEGSGAKYRKQEMETLMDEPKAGRSVSDADVATVKKAMPNRIRVTASGGKNPGANLKPMVKKAGGGMVKGYKNGGCVMSGRGGKYKGAM